MADTQMNQGDLTLEETNKVRISLGLKPIGESAGDGENGADDAPVDTDAIAEDNYAERRAEMRRAKEKSDLEERIAKYVSSRSSRSGRLSKEHVLPYRSRRGGGPVLTATGPRTSKRSRPSSRARRSAWTRPTTR